MDAKAIRPLGNRVLLEIVAVEEVETAAGILLPSSRGPSDTHKADVVAVGPDVNLVDMGDLVLVTTYSGDSVEYDQEAYRIVEEGTILAIIER